jgi:hypothetical protein
MKRHTSQMEDANDCGLDQRAVCPRRGLEVSPRSPLLPTHFFFRTSATRATRGSQTVEAGKG